MPRSTASAGPSARALSSIVVSPCNGGAVGEDLRRIGPTDGETRRPVTTETDEVGAYWAVLLKLLSYSAQRTDRSLERMLPGRPARQRRPRRPGCSPRRSGGRPPRGGSSPRGGP